jgi:hypothetical protein
MDIPRREKKLCAGRLSRFWVNKGARLVEVDVESSLSMRERLRAEKKTYL